MKADELNLQRDLKFDLEQGVVSFGTTRLVLFDADAIGLLRQGIIEQLGTEGARRLFLRLGYVQGFSDFKQLGLQYKFDDPKEHLLAGPILHTWEGVASVRPLMDPIIDPQERRFQFRGLWVNSYEAQQHLSHYPEAKDPVCWSQQGYGSGYASAFMNAPTVLWEDKCIGKGDDVCEWSMDRADLAGEMAAAHREAFADFWQASFPKG